MANHTIGADQLDEQRSSPEGMLQREEQTPEQEESQHHEQSESEQEQQDMLAAQETEHEYSAVPLHATLLQSEMRPQQEDGELVEPTLGQPDDAVKSSAPAESAEPEAVPVIIEPLGGADE